MKTAETFKPGPSMRTEHLICDHYGEIPAGENQAFHSPDPLAEIRQIRSEISLKPGLWMSIIECFPDQRTGIRYEGVDALLNFGFMLSGVVTTKIHSLRTHTIDLENHAGMAGITFLPEPRGLLEIEPGKRVQMLHIHADKGFLRSSLQMDFEDFHPKLRALVEGNHNEPFFFRENMSPSVQAVAHQIVCGNHFGIPERIYFEGKALELISLEIGEFNRYFGEWKKNAMISPDETEKIVEAARLLVNDLERPPSLSDLAKNVNLSIRRLETGFQTVFNVSVFGFLRDYKMQKARQLFLGTSMNVSEVAWRVGYTNVSHFSTAYKKTFGILPKRFLKELRT